MIATERTHTETVATHFVYKSTRCIQLIYTKCIATNFCIHFVYMWWKYKYIHFVYIYNIV